MKSNILQLNKFYSLIAGRNQCLTFSFFQTIESSRQPDSQTARQPDSQTARQPDSQTARQPDSQTARQP
ncbi:MAG: hypothetical protein LBV16_03040, partial [Elusimicrobiota bacterium]|nr:hypothetical protein [Elusimicrobiota bacterium]